MNRKELVNYILLNSKYSIDEISTKIKVDRSNVYLWKKGKSKPKVDNINKMAAITGHNIKWLNEDKIELAIKSGQRIYGENRVQEAQERWHKRIELYNDIELRLIGPLQTNKVKQALKLFNIIETIDREKLAREISNNLNNQSKRSL